MSAPIFVVDAFAERPFQGNPAAVCLLSDSRDDEWMRSVAAEMKHSETAFVRTEGDELGLRWFTPEAEVDLCGHATLAAAHVLWETERAPLDQAIVFRTRSGALSARRLDATIEIDLPALPVEQAEIPSEVLSAARVGNPVRTARNRQTYLIELGSEAEVRGLRPDMRALREWTRAGPGGDPPDHRLLVTARATTPGFDFVSRYFAPAVGVPEDPVTGVAHCVLGPYWQAHVGRDRFVGYQASERGGVVHVEVRGDRVALGGSAVTVLRGALWT